MYTPYTCTTYICSSYVQIHLFPNSDPPATGIRTK